ncbi:MAG TPA: TonB-dependent receptor [Ignavibacteria bacterium]
MTRLFLFVLLLFVNSAFAQKGSIEGEILDKDNNNPVIGANITLSSLQMKTVSDINGLYKFENIPAGNYTLTISHVGYAIGNIAIQVIDGKKLKLSIKLAPSSITVGEIVVSSVRYETLIKDVSLPMEVATGEEISERSYLTVPDILKVKSGIALTRDGIWATDISIRGLSKNNVVTLIDGNRIETATDLSARLSMIDLNDIDRIEVIKGAASSLYGTGAFGGVVNIFTKNGFFNNRPYITGSLTGSFNSVNDNGNGSINLNTGASRWYLKLTGSMRSAKNINTPNGELKNSQFNDNSFSGNLGIMPFKNQEFKLQYQRYEARDIGIPGGGTLFPAIAIVSYPKEKRDMISGEYSIKNILPYLVKVSLKYFYQSILRDVVVLPAQVVTKPTQRVSVLKLTPNARHYTNGVQFQTDWQIGKFNYLIAGLDLWRRNLDSKRERFQKIETLDSVTHNVNSTTYKTTGERPIPESDYTSLGAYAQNETKLFSDKLKMTLGGRIDRVKTTNALTYNPVYEIVNNGIINYTPAGQKIIWNSRETEDLSWSGNLGLLYNAFKDIDFTFTAARSFRSPSLEERYQYIDLGNLVRIGNPDLVPEKGLFFDAGVRIWKNNLNITGNVYINSFKDLVAEIPGTYEGRPAYIKTNIGEARYYGFDFDFIYNIYKQVLVYGTLAYVRGEDTGNNTDLPQVPPLNGRLGIKIPLFSYVTIDFSSILFAEQNKIAAGEITTPGYATFDLGIYSNPLKYYGMKFQLVGGIENILDKSYRDHLATNRGSITSEPGRNFYFRVNVDW